MNSSIESPVIEIAGVSGVGKTTLIRNLVCKNNLAIKISLRHLLSSNTAILRYAALAAWNYRSLFFARANWIDIPEQCYLLRKRIIYRIEEMRSLARILAFSSEDCQIKSGLRSPRLIDQGPIYNLAFLEVMRTSEARPELKDLTNFLCKKIGNRIDGVIYLYGSDEKLMPRRKSRADWNKYQKVFITDRNIALHHADYVIAYKHIINLLRHQKQIPVFDLDTTQMNIDDVTDAAASFLSSYRADMKSKQP
ncbi:MAG: hypothetical protein IPM20_03585 [Gammaproteobacteria bacterium]|nr:hypothetical protein [Gammaproteobacteria bacterium]